MPQYLHSPVLKPHTLCNEGLLVWAKLRTDHLTWNAAKHLLRCSTFISAFEPFIIHRLFKKMRSPAATIEPLDGVLNHPTSISIHSVSTIESLIIYRPLNKPYSPAPSAEPLSIVLDRILMSQASMQSPLSKTNWWLLVVHRWVRRRAYESVNFAVQHYTDKYIQAHQGWIAARVACWPF